MDETASIKIESALGDRVAAARAPIHVPRWSFAWLVCVLLRAYNALRRALLSSDDVAIPKSQELREVRKLASKPSDINEHLELIFAEALLSRPHVIVELGVRGGLSTFVFERVANLCEVSIISADIEDCSKTSSHPRRYFFHGDDVQFAHYFQSFCRERNIPPVVDLLFIDTSHYYEHTVLEIAAWFPLLSSRAKVIFHDTNMKLVGPRKDGCVELSWDNKRGVVRAIEEHLGISIDETKEFKDSAGGWLIRHWPNCNGLTILDRI
jgi:cephalosporin hydroxylase